MGYLWNTASAASIYRGQTKKKDGYERKTRELKNICGLPEGTKLGTSKEAERVGTTTSEDI